MPQRLFIIIESKDVFSIYEVKVCSLLLQFTVPVFSVSSFHGTFEASKTKNGGVAIDGAPQGSMHGPVGHSRNSAFCHKLPVLYEVFRMLFKC